MLSLQTNDPPLPRLLMGPPEQRTEILCVCLIRLVRLPGHFSASFPLFSRLVSVFLPFWRSVCVCVFVRETSAAADICVDPPARSAVCLLFCVSLRCLAVIFIFSGSLLGRPIKWRGPSWNLWTRMTPLTTTGLSRNQWVSRGGHTRPSFWFFTLQTETINTHNKATVHPACLLSSSFVFMTYLLRNHVETKVYTVIDSIHGRKVFCFLIVWGLFLFFFLADGFHFSARNRFQLPKQAH